MYPTHSSLTSPLTYNGEVEDQPTDKTTHIIVPSEEGGDTQLPWDTQGAQVVTVKWLEDSLSEGHLLPTEKYSLYA